MRLVLQPLDCCVHAPDFGTVVGADVHISLGRALTFTFSRTRVGDQIEDGVGKGGDADVDTGMHLDKRSCCRSLCLASCCLRASTPRDPVRVMQA